VPISGTNFNDEFKEVEIKIEESKRSARRNSLNYEKTNLDNHMVDREQIEKFSSTNTEKMRYFNSSLKHRRYIRFKESWNYFSSSDLSEEKKTIIIEDFSHYNCIQRMILNCQKKLILNNELLEERILIFSIAKISLNYNDEFHQRIITTIYKTLTGELECQLFGDHWIKIGFQGSDPRTDLRGVGIFGLMQFLAFMDRFQIYAREIYEYSLSETYNFPLLSLCFNFSFMSLEALRNGILIEYCNIKQSVIIVINDFYSGLADYFFQKFKFEQHSIHQIPKILQELKELAFNKPNLILSRTLMLLDKYPECLKDSMTLNNIQNE
jgi:hypothetical protein